MTIPPAPAPDDPEAARQASPYGADAPAGAIAPQQPVSEQPGYVQPGYAHPGYAQPGTAVPGAFAPPPPKGLSITAISLGIGGLVIGWMLLGLPSVAAVIFGHIALRREPAGRALAITGLVTGYIGIAVGAIVVVMSVMSLVLGLSSIFALWFAAVATDPGLTY